MLRIARRLVAGVVMTISGLFLYVVGADGDRLWRRIGAKRIVRWWRRVPWHMKMWFVGAFITGFCITFKEIYPPAMMTIGGIGIGIQYSPFLAHYFKKELIPDEEWEGTGRARGR